MINKLLILLVFMASTAFAQVSVVLSPLPHMQFFDSSGRPLANGKVFTYDAGTTNLRNTYKDSTGIPQNTDPIILDAGGFADIWLANQSYKFIVQNSLGVQQWTVDNISGSFALLNSANTWTFPQTFTQPITDTATDNQFVLGAFGNQTTLDFPPPAGNIVLHFPNTPDTMVGRATTDTLTNKTLTSPVINGGTITGTTLSGTTLFSILTSAAATPALSGNIRLAAADSICLRNTFNSADQCITVGTRSGVSFMSIDGLSIHLGNIIAPASSANLGLSASPVVSGAGATVSINASDGVTAGLGGLVLINPGSGAGGSLNGSVGIARGMCSVIAGGNGCQQVRVASCTTGAGAASTCNTTVNWPNTNFDSTAYTAVCTIDNPTGTPYVLNTSSKAIGSIVVTIANLTAIASSGTLNCIGLHD